jgi:hypothetical protein
MGTGMAPGSTRPVTGCSGKAHIRHDEQGTRSVTPEAYTAEVATAQRERPHTRFIVHDHDIMGDRAWFHFYVDVDGRDHRRNQDPGRDAGLAHRRRQARGDVAHAGQARFEMAGCSRAGTLDEQAHITKRDTRLWA